jgi:glycosyltransferase involved in cell wall biosynthesis
MTRRCLLDVSSLARWSGPATGMTRVEHELLEAARAMPSVVPVFHDPQTGTFRTLTDEWGARILGWHAAIDGWGSDYVVVRRGWRAFVPSRYPIMRALERRRLMTGSRFAARMYDWLQRVVLAVKSHRFPLDTADGQRLSVVPRELALGEPVALRPDDVVFAASSDWLYRDLETIARAKASVGFSYAVVCYDIIPLLFPHFFPAEDVEVFRTYWHRMFNLADLTIVNAAAIREDVERYCLQQNITPPRMAVVPLAAQQPARNDEVALPEGLARDRYILFVSTIEPRKNHRMLLAVWRDLLDRGVPQSFSFKLVFVGRAGWMVDDLLAEIGDSTRWNGALLHLDRVEDAALNTLYRNAAFCVYPSYYEGFGLPVIEAHARGTAAIFSNGGALREFAHLGPSLPPDDVPAWCTTIERWIRQPDLRTLPTAADADKFVHRTWRDVANEMLDAAGIR